MRCYFHLMSDDDTILDETGVEVTDIAAAEAEALAAIRQLRDEDDEAEEEWQGWQLRVTDWSGHVLLSIRLDAAPDRREHEVSRRVDLLS